MYDGYNIGSLPTFAALEVLPVLQGNKRSATIRFDETYLDGIRSVLESINKEGQFRNRLQSIQDSQQQFEEITVEVPSKEESDLKTASKEMHDMIESIPEINHLRSAYPGDSIIFPQILQSPDRQLSARKQVNFGIRIFFFRKSEAPTSDELISENINAIIGESPREFERYVGELLGYPDCCINAFRHREAGKTPPEAVSVNPLESKVKTESISEHDSGEISIDQLLPNFFEDSYAYAFFAREFFPERQCDRAESVGKGIFKELKQSLNERLVRDYFRINYLYCYVIASAAQDQSRLDRPRIGELGIEHMYSYLPMSAMTTISRYRKVN